MSNWAEYDRALVQRGDITLWIAPDAADAWTVGKTRRSAEGLRSGNRNGTRALAHLQIAASTGGGIPSLSLVADGS